MSSSSTPHTASSISSARSMIGLGLAWPGRVGSACSGRPHQPLAHHGHEYVDSRSTAEELASPEAYYLAAARMAGS